VFLDIAWIKEKLPNSVEHIKKKLPSMYHQFKQLADLDITKEPMEVGPTTHYIMGGIQVDGDSQMSSVAGLFAAANARRAARGESLRWKFAFRLAGVREARGEYAAKFAKENAQGSWTKARWMRPPKRRWLLSSAARGRESVCGAERVAGCNAGAGRDRSRRK